jgi:hypothetical protein
MRALKSCTCSTGIEDRLLYPGDYNYGEPGASDTRVYSETGCTCVLITSPSDQLR